MGALISRQAVLPEAAPLVSSDRRAVEPFQDIREFLGAVRARLLRRAAARAALLAAAALAGTLLVLPLAAARVAESRATTLQGIALGMAAALVAVAAVAGIVAPRRRFREDREVARLVGRRAPHVASDLLSTVELERELRGAPAFSPELAVALAGATAEKVRELDLEALVPGRGVRRAAQGLFAVAALYAVAAALFPSSMAAGWRRLVVPGALGEGIAARPVDGPIVGDVTLTLEYPAYTRRPTLVIPASSGDVVAPRGTRVTFETTALYDTARARIVFDGEKLENAVPMEVSGRTLRASLKVDRSVSYRFWIEPRSGDPVTEAEPHRIDVESDRAPRVELVAPADELEVSSRKRVELAYTVEDDYGIGEIALVWRAASGREERKPLPPPRPGARTAQAKLVWDLSEVPLEPGARVAYRVEARDNDEVAGPNVGASRTYYLRVYSPRERHEQLVAMQEAAFERAVSALGDRLETAPDDPAGIEAAQRATRALLGDLTALIPLVEKDRFSPRKLASELAAMAARLDKLVRDEAAALELRDARRIRAIQPRIVAELERDVLSLFDWIERQRLEDVLAITDEIRQHRERLKELLAEYRRARSAETRAEIERELRNLERRIAELERKLAGLGGETEDRFLHADALEGRDVGDCLARVRALLDRGDVEGAMREEERCHERMERQAQALEDALRGQRGEKFSEEEQALAELMSEVGDLEADQSEVAREADRLLDQYKQRAAEIAREQANPARERARQAVSRLKEELARVPRGSLTPFGQEEYDYLGRRVDDVGKMLDEGDVAEALAMARQAKESLEFLEAEVEDDLEDGKPWSDRTREALEHLAAADPILDEILRELEQATPSPEEIMNASDKRQLEDLRRRQQRLRERAERLLQKVKRRAGELPGRVGDEAQRGLAEAREHMNRADGRFDRRDPMGGRDEARRAAEKLAEMRGGMPRASRPSAVEGMGRANDEETVRIPGSDEYKPPEEFREDILEAMKKERAPDAYREQVKRYYEELVK